MGVGMRGDRSVGVCVGGDAGDDLLGDLKEGVGDEVIGDLVLIGGVGLAGVPVVRIGESGCDDVVGYGDNFARGA